MACFRIRFIETNKCAGHNTCQASSRIQEPTLISRNRIIPKPISLITTGLKNKDPLVLTKLCQESSLPLFYCRWPSEQARERGTSGFGNFFSDAAAAQRLANCVFKFSGFFLKPFRELFWKEIIIPRNIVTKHFSDIVTLLENGRHITVTDCLIVVWFTSCKYANFSPSLRIP